MPTKISKSLYRVQVYVGKDENGKRSYKSFYGETKKEAEYNALVFKMGAGKGIRQTVTLRVAMEAYINSKDGVLAMSTIINYRRMMASFGDYLDTPLSSVNSLNLQSAMTAFAKRKKENGQRVSAKTVKNMYGLITATLHQNDIWPRNITLPRVEAVDYNTPFDEELGAIFRATRGTSVELPVLLAAFCSLRRSEILGLRFADVDYKAGTISIQQAKVYVGGQTEIKAPKNKTSRRIVFMPDYLAEKIKAEQDKHISEYVCPMSGNTITGRFGIILAKNNLPRCRFHDLRHSFVSVLAAHGIDKKYVQEMGGWSSERVMNERYKQTSFDVKKAISKDVETVFLNILQH